MAIGDTFISGDYLCTILSESTVYSQANTVHIQTNDKTKVSYATPPRQVTYSGRTYSTDLYAGRYGGISDPLPGCFAGCKNLKIGPDIPMRSTPSFDDLTEVFKGCTSLTSVGSLPANLDSMTRMFEGCSSLVTAPVIPSSVTHMDYCFEGCLSLVTAPVIPSSVTHMGYCFEGCTSLSGEVVINATDLSYLYRAFYGTEKGIWLTGSSSERARLAATANNGNVFVGEIPLDYSLTAERVGSDGGTTPEPEGNWLHLVANISWGNFAANSIDSMALMINGTSISATAYTDATKTEAITLPGWQPAANAEAHAWVQVDADTQVITFTISDAYHTGAAITFTVPQVFRTFDFLAGGKGIAAGAVAEEEGFHFAMEPFFRTLAGMVQMFAGATPPNGWLVCDGSEQLISDYPELYAAIENTYGTPSDSGHFLLPDLRDRFPVGAGSSYSLNDTGGEAEVTLETSQMPAHTHGLNNHTHGLTNAAGVTGDTWAGDSYGSISGSGSKLPTVKSSGTSVKNLTATGGNSGSTTSAGDGQPHENRPPYIGLNFIIHTGRPTISA